MKTEPKLNPYDFYFWLGAGAESLTLDEFEKKIDEYEALLRKYEDQSAE